MHEAWNYGEIVDASHSSAEQAGRLAQEAGVDELVLTHLHPLVHAESLTNEARTEFEKSSALYDGWAMDFPSD
jgi:ribonuclease BN (tRNA processing enzyme)